MCRVARQMNTAGKLRIQFDTGTGQELVRKMYKDICKATAAEIDETDVIEISPPGQQMRCNKLTKHVITNANGRYHR